MIHCLTSVQIHSRYKTWGGSWLPRVNSFLSQDGTLERPAKLVGLRRFQLALLLPRLRQSHTLQLKIIVGILVIITLIVHIQSHFGLSPRKLMRMAALGIRSPGFAPGWKRAAASPCARPGPPIGL